MQRRDRKNKTVEIPSMEQVAEARKNIRYKRRYQVILRSTVGILTVVAAVAVLVVTLVMPILQISGTSMSPTLQDGQIVLSVKSTDLHTGDLVAFYQGNKLLIKRCIAGPADWVNITEDGTVYVNEKPLDEPYISEKSLGKFCNIEFPYQVPADRWFVLGDNRDESIDSRNDTIGCVASDQIVGKVVFRIWPMADFGTL